MWEMVMQLDTSVNSEFFKELNVVTEALRMHDTGPAFAWCERHHDQLAQLNSDVEFQLHKQHFVTLLGTADGSVCLKYMHEHLFRYSETHAGEIQKVIGIPLGVCVCACALAIALESMCNAYAPRV